jgi:hypothetical protein
VRSVIFHVAYATVRAAKVDMLNKEGRGCGSVAFAVTFIPKAEATAAPTPPPPAIAGAAGYLTPAYGAGDYGSLRGVTITGALYTICTSNSRLNVSVGLRANYG